VRNSGNQDMEILALTERIEKTLELGESQFREFKSALEGPPGQKKPRDPKGIRKDICETLVAFANAEGGELLIGVEDDATLTGVPFPTNEVQKLIDAPKHGIHSDSPLPSFVGRSVTIRGHAILYFSVDKSTQVIHQTSDGKCLQRKDLDSRPVSLQQLHFERQEQLSREYDRQFVDGASVGDLDLTLLKKVADHTTKMSPEKTLQYLGLAEWGGDRLRLRRAAMLLFAADITRWHPRCQVRVVRVRGTELKTGRDYNAAPEDVATGNVLKIVSEAWDKLRLHLVETKMSPGALFRESIMYPEDACREALANAITHRDYSQEGQSIEIYIFDDRMEVKSPGGLLATITVESLRKLSGVHESRNAHLARVLREIGYIREMGEGMRRMFKLMQDADLVAPDLIAEKNRFTIVLRHRSVFSEADQRWVDGFPPALKLSRQEILVTLMGRDGTLLSPQQIYDRLNLVDWDVYRSIIDQLLTKGIVKNVIPRLKKMHVAKSRGVSQRAIPRLAVRQPAEVEVGLAELLARLKEVGAVARVDGDYFSKVLTRLSVGNPYKIDHIHLRQLFRVLEFIDDKGRPTGLLVNIWGQTPPAPPVPPSERTSREVSHTPRQDAVKPAGVHGELYVGNLDYKASPRDVAQLFRQFGTVTAARIPPDYSRAGGRGFAVVRMSNEAESQAAIAGLNGTNFMGRPLVVRWYE
jgi:ATP-dependent DNA helicase RecG